MGKTMNTNFMKSLIMTGACAMLLAISTAAFAESDIGFKAIGPRLGYVDPGNDLDGAVEFGAAMEFGEFVRQLHWNGSVSFWSTGREYRYFNDRYDWTSRDIILRTGVDYHFIEGDWEPYAGGGLGLHFYSRDYGNAPNYGDSDENKLGLYIDGGVEHQLGERWTGQLQVQLDFADPDQTALMFNLLYVLK